MTLLGLADYTPFLDPLDLQRGWWALLVPLAVLISIAWKAVRVSSFRAFWRPVLVMSTQIVLAMVGLAVGAYVVVEVIVPALG